MTQVLVDVLQQISTSLHIAYPRITITFAFETSIIDACRNFVHLQPFVNSKCKNIHVRRGKSYMDMHIQTYGIVLHMLTMLITVVRELNEQPVDMILVLWNIVFRSSALSLIMLLSKQIIKHMLN
jgi:hypothetical protein